MDRLPPYAQESELAVIGCCLTTPMTSLPECQQVLGLNYFYDLRCQVVWELMVKMEAREVNVITVRQKLLDQKIITSDAIDSMLNSAQDLAVSAANLPTWIDELVEKFILREVIAKCTQLTSDAYEARGAHKLLDRAEREILSIRPSQRSSTGIKTLVMEAIDKIEKKFNLKGGIGGLPTGLVDLDRITDGLHEGEMVVICAMPSTGKTALAVNIAVYNALRGTPVAICSAEMRPVQLVVRSICSEAHANYHNLTEAALAQMSSVVGPLSAAPIHIEACHGQTAGQVCATIRRLHQKYGIKVAVVDFIQLLTGTGDNREQEVASISHALKGVGLELGITIIALSQLNDEGKLRDSRVIGQDADTILKLENDGERQPKIQPINLLVDKSRDGETGLIKLTFFKEHTRFHDCAKVDPSDVEERNPHND